MKNSEKNSRHVTFDEEVIAEHDKERGTRMPIPEPDTPFLRSAIMSSDDESEPPVLDLGPSPSEMLSQAVRISVEQTERDEAKHAEFLKKRKAHYNEFRVLKGAESSGSEDEKRAHPSP